MVYSPATRATASRPARRRSALPAGLVAAATAATAWIGSRNLSTGFAQPQRNPQALEEQKAGLRRREAAASLAAAAGIPVLGAELPAFAEEAVNGRVTQDIPKDVKAKVSALDTSVASGKTDARLARLLINVENDEAMNAEMTFWTKALGMKVLSDGKVADGNREVIMSFGSEKDAGNFAIQARIDPALASRAKPKFLNFDVLQPTVDALNFVQVSQPGKVIDVFEKVQAAGGSAMIGDYGYFDVTSPRDVPVRIVSKEGLAAKVDHICMNIEVPAFEATNKFYQRALGFKEVAYPSEEPPVQQLSKFYASKAGGPKLLLSPVPDKRLKDRQLDEFEGLLAVTGSAPALVTQVQGAVALAEKEQAEKRTKAEEALMGAKGTIKTKEKLSETVAKPSITPAADTGGLSTIDDGLGNFIFVAAQDEFEKRVA